MIFCAGIGIALIIPITSSVNAYYLTKKRDTTSQDAS